MKEIKIIWNTDDVLMRSDELGVQLTEEEADQILDDLYNYHDASIGICWDIIGSYIYQYETERAEQYYQELKTTLI